MVTRNEEPKAGTDVFHSEDVNSIFQQGHIDNGDM